MAETEPGEAASSDTGGEGPREGYTCVILLLLMSTSAERPKLLSEISTNREGSGTIDLEGKSRLYS